MSARAGRTIASLLALASLATGLWWGTFAAGGADSYGYVSQAELWTRGTLIARHPFGELTPTFGPRPFAPLGYRPGREPDTLVPTYPPGLPLTMALASLVLGPPAVYWVVPIRGALAVLLTYRLGTHLDGQACGVGAAALVATSPVFLYQLVQPMSDVPAMAWWLAAIVLATRPTAARALAAGLAASMAILTRPNLVPLAAISAAIATVIPHRVTPAARARALGWFAAGVLPGCATVAWLNATLYGSMLRSGYGTLSDLYALENVWPNSTRYLRWLVTTQTAFPSSPWRRPSPRGGAAGTNRPNGKIPFALASSGSRSRTSGWSSSYTSHTGRSTTGRICGFSCPPGQRF